MIWQRHSQSRWLSTDIKPLTIEVKALKKGGAAWRVISDSVDKPLTLAKGKADHPLTAMDVAAMHAKDLAKHFKSHAVEEHTEKNNIPVQDLKLPNDIKTEDFVGYAEDAIVLPDEPSTSNH